jgi:N-acetylglucosaminyl-diphospho-decaprenol L-rhamnosyltransferase
MAQEIQLISLIIISYNSAAILPKLLQSIQASSYPHYEIIIIDNAAEAHLPDLVKQIAPQAQLVVNAENKGFGAACNQGAAIARGSVLMFLNPDIEFTPTALETLAQRYRGNPQRGILCPSTLYPNETREAHNQLIDVQQVPGCALMIPKAYWQQLQGFDETMFLYWEDTEFCWRAHMQGIAVQVDLQAIVYHERGGSGGGAQWDAERLKNGIYTHLKLKPWSQAIPFTVLSLFKSLIKWSITRNPQLLEVGRWNWQQLGLTLAKRRMLLERFE